MKKILFLFLSFYSVLTAFGQERSYKPFKLDLGIGLVIPTGNTFLDQRFSFSVEPAYNISNEVSLGLRAEFDPYLNFAGTDAAFVIKSMSSYLLTGDYFFKNTKMIKPFIGIGGGIFNQSLVPTDLTTAKIKSEKPGFETRLGFERKHLRVAVEYNVIFFKEEKKMNYLSIKIAAVLWGGHKNQ